VALFCKVSKNRKVYNSSNKNSILSRQIKGYHGYSLKPESMQWLASIGNIEDLVENARRMAIPVVGSKR